MDGEVFGASRNRNLYLRTTSFKFIQNTRWITRITFLVFRVSKSSFFAHSNDPLNRTIRLVKPRIMRAVAKVGRRVGFNLLLWLPTESNSLGEFSMRSLRSNFARRLRGKVPSSFFQELWKWFRSEVATIVESKFNRTINITFGVWHHASSFDSSGQFLSSFKISAEENGRTIFENSAT